MSFLKLAVYGGLGYLTYQLFFAELEPRQQTQKGRSEERPPQRAEKSREGGQQKGGGSPRGQQLTGGGDGIDVSTKERGGASTSHRVGRGVI